MWHTLNYTQKYCCWTLFVNEYNFCNRGIANIYFKALFEIMERCSEITSLTLYSPVVSLCTTNFNIQKFYTLPTLCICVVYGSQNNERFPYTKLTD
jgi:hypothetical protein